MSKQVFQSILVAFVAFTLMLSGCSDFDEMKSDRLLLQAETLMEQGNELQAEEVLADLIARYPGTQSGEKAGKQLFQIQQRRELRERAEFTKILDSYRQVLDGYHALYAEYPHSVSALDQSEYFFDSAYLEEIIPDGYKVYLWLKSDGSGYRVWCVAEEKERGYAVENLRRKLVPFERYEIQEEIKARFQTIDGTGKMIALQVQN